MIGSAFYSSKKTVGLLVMVVAFAIIVSAAPRAYAQADGPCCAQTDIQKITCQSTGCKGTLTYQSCAQPTGPGATHWKVEMIGCCQDKFENFVVGTGYDKGCESEVIVARAPSTALDKALYAGGVWVRTCAGKYALHHSAS